MFFFLTKSSKPWFPSLEKSASQKDTLKRLGCGGVWVFKWWKAKKQPGEAAGHGVLLTPKTCINPQNKSLVSRGWWWKSDVNSPQNWIPICKYLNLTFNLLHLHRWWQHPRKNMSWHLDHATSCSGWGPTKTLRYTNDLVKTQNPWSDCTMISVRDKWQSFIQFLMIEGVQVFLNKFWYSTRKSFCWRQLNLPAVRNVWFPTAGRYFSSGSVKRTPSKSVEPTLHETDSSPLKMDGCKLEDLNEDPNPTPKDVCLIQPGCTLLTHGFWLPRLKQ